MHYSPGNWKEEIINILVPTLYQAHCPKEVSSSGLAGQAWVPEMLDLGGGAWKDEVPGNHVSGSQWDFQVTRPLRVGPPAQGQGYQEQG